MLLLLMILLLKTLSVRLRGGLVVAERLPNDLDTLDKVIIRMLLHFCNGVRPQLNFHTVRGMQRETMSF